MTMRAGDVYEHPFERLVVRVGTVESGGAQLIADLYVPVGTPGVPRHVHPVMEETLTLIHGKLGTWVAGTEKVLAPGDRVQIAAGTPHRWWPLGDENVRVLLEVRPGDRFEEMWRQFMGLAQDGKMHPKRGPKFLQIVALQREFSDVMQVAGIPPLMQRLLFGALAPIARARGYRGKYDEYLTRGPSAIVELEPLPGQTSQIHGKQPLSPGGVKG